jgi:hypothetical protein
MGNCLGPSQPPVVFTICPVDGKAHEFGEVKGEKSDWTKLRPCRCNKTKEQVVQEARMCQNDEHAWVMETVTIPAPQAAQAQAPSQPPAPGVAMQPGTAIPVGVPVQTMQVAKCTRCGMRRTDDGHYDDYYMYGGGYMMGSPMFMFGMMGASDMAYMDYNDYGGMGDEGFMADDGGGLFGDDDGGGFDF